MNIPRIELIQLNSVTAANAYKEYAHLLSDSNIKRLADAGLFNKNNSWKSSKSMAKGIKAKFMFRGDTPIHETYLKQPHYSVGYPHPNKDIEAKIRRAHNLRGLSDNADRKIRQDTGRNAILINRDYIRKELKIPANKQNLGDVLYHELHEKNAVDNGIISTNFQFLNEVSHYHPKVIVEDFKKYNQTGGASTRVQPDMWAIRNQKDPREYASIIKHLNTSKRLKNSDYKKAYKAMERDDDIY